MHKNNELETYCTDAVYIMFAPETDTDRVHPRIGSGHGSDLHFTARFCALFSIIRILTVVT